MSAALKFRKEVDEVATRIKASVEAWVEWAATRVSLVFPTTHEGKTVNIDIGQGFDNDQPNTLIVYCTQFGVMTILVPQAILEFGYSMEKLADAIKAEWDRREFISHEFTEWNKVFRDNLLLFEGTCNEICNVMIAILVRENDIEGKKLSRQKKLPNSKLIAKMISEFNVYDKTIFRDSVLLRIIIEKWKCTYIPELDTVAEIVDFAKKCTDENSELQTCEEGFCFDGRYGTVILPNDVLISALNNDLGRKRRRKE